jgi:hypothetical protein
MFTPGSLSALQVRMQEDFDNGAQPGWLIEPEISVCISTIRTARLNAWKIKWSSLVIQYYPDPCSTSVNSGSLSYSVSGEAYRLCAWHARASPAGRRNACGGWLSVLPTPCDTQTWTTTRAVPARSPTH